MSEITAILFPEQVGQLQGLAKLHDIERDELLGRLIEKEYQRVIAVIDRFPRGSTDE